MIEPSDDHPLRITVEDRVATITLHRPEVRNAIDPAMRRGIQSSFADLEADDGVDVLVLTGADPAFCAGLDLRLLGEDSSQLLRQGGGGSSSPFPPRTKPLIGAINGAAITGGFELALNCDFLVASERAVFADTHARVGVMPGWGLTALLADAVGRTRAREISLTGNFVSAEQALAWGLVNRVVPHDELLSTVHGIATDIVGNDQVGVRRMLATYAAQSEADLAEAWALETAGAREFAETVEPGAEVEARRQGIIERGRRQI